MVFFFIKMDYFKIERRNNEITSFEIKNNEIDDLVTYKIVNFITSLSNCELNYYDKFKIHVYKILNKQNIPSYWCGYIFSYDTELIRLLHEYENFPGGWDFSNENLVGFGCDRDDDTIIEDKFKIKNIEGTYKSPSWIMEKLKKYLDEFMIFHLGQQINNL
jgi:hypothetical protein